MKSRRPLALFVAILMLALFSAAEGRSDEGSLPPAALRPHYVPGELLVKYRPEAAAAIASSVLRSSATVKRRYAGVNIHHLQLPAQTSVEEAQRTFTNDPAVEYAEPNYLRYVTSTIPNDTFFPNLWGLHNTGQIVMGAPGTPGADIHAAETWDITKGNSAIIAAVIDSGVDYNHPDLAGNISPGLRYDFVNDDADPMDSDDHGTHVAGTIAAAGNNGTGVTGVSWAATVMPLRAGSALGILSVSSIVSAIDYAVNHGAKVINASYGGYDFSQAEYDAIDNARKAGVLFVAAAGNASKNIDAYPEYRSYPACYNLDNIIAVAATDQYDNLASFSDYGAVSVHVAAPGVNIYSTKPARRTIWSSDFDSGSMNGWATGGTNPTWGVSPSRHYSGAYSLAVNPAGNYQANTDSWAQAPLLDLSASSGSKLSFAFTGNSESGRDFLFVETSTDGSTWTNRDIYITDGNGYYIDTYTNGFSGDRSRQWYHAVADLGNHDGRSTVYVRFHFTSNASTNYLGWFIDNIAVTAASSTYVGSEYQYMSGTSMATPHVTGLAALIWGFKPELTYTQVKSIILSSVDAKSSLAGKILSGGRINAFRALSALNRATPLAPASLAASVSSPNSVNLTWVDSSPDESGFHVERKTGDGTYSLISAAPKNSITYGDTGLKSATTYCYRVASFNDGGDSDYSNEACVTTSSTSGAGVSTKSSGGGGGEGATSGGGGCFIATAAYGSPMERQVQVLREFRDGYLVKCSAGRAFVSHYYRISPPIADMISRNAILKAITRWCLLPVIGVAYLMVQYGLAATSVVFLLMALFVLFFFKYGFLPNPVSFRHGPPDGQPERVENPIGLRRF